MSDNSDSEQATIDSETEQSQKNDQKKKKGRLHGWRLTIAAAVFFLAVVANLLIPLPYYVLSPGSTVAVNQFVKLPADKEHVPSGKIMLTTVSLLEAHPADIVWAWLTPGTRIEKKKLILGDSTPKQFNEQSAQQMDGSQMAAIYVAMQRAGYDATIRGDGAIVRNVGAGLPASGKINVGDLIVAVDSTPVNLSSDVSANVRKHKPGENVLLKVRDANNAERTVDLVTAPLPDSPAIPYIGVNVETKNIRLDTPFPVQFEETKIGGPSAGLAFTLALIDDLTPGELTGGQKIATTGTMASDGSVGEVGGVEQKTRSVKKAGAKLFIVPRSEEADAKKYAGSMKVVGVDNIEQAVDALRANGGDVSGIPASVTLKPVA
jgi:PDZ domain-containing protein